MALADNRLHRTLTLCALYLAQGIPWGFMSITLVSFLNDKGLDEAGGGKLKAIILLPWAFKLIWAPLLDSVTVRSMGRRRFWILLGQLGMAGTLLVMLSQGADVLRGEMDVGQVAAFLAIAFFIHNCFASLQDVATDALAVDILPPEEQGLTNGLMWGAKLFGQRGGAWLLGAVLAGTQNGLFNAVLIQLLALLFIMIAPIIFLERKGEKRFPWSSIDEPQEKTSVSSGQNPYHIIRNLFGGFSLASTVAFAGVPLVAMLGFGSIEVINSAMYTSKLGWTSAEFSEVSGGYAIPFILVSTILGGILGDRYGRRLLISLAVLGFSFTVVGFSFLPVNKWSTIFVAEMDRDKQTLSQSIDFSPLSKDIDLTFATFDAIISPNLSVNNQFTIGDEWSVSVNGNRSQYAFTNPDRNLYEDLRQAILDNNPSDSLVASSTDTGLVIKGITNSLSSKNITTKEVRFQFPNASLDIQWNLTLPLLDGTGKTQVITFKVGDANYTRSNVESQLTDKLANKYTIDTILDDTTGILTLTMLPVADGAALTDLPWTAPTRPLYSFRVTVREMVAAGVNPKVYKTKRIYRETGKTIAQQINESSLINGEPTKTLFVAGELGQEEISLSYKRSANYLPAIITGPRSTLSKIFLLLGPFFFACYVVNFLAGAMNLSWTQSSASMFTVYMTLSNVGDVVGKNAAGAIAQTFTTTGVYGENIVDYPMVFRVIAGLALMSLILLPVINFNYLKELKASNANPKMTPVPDVFTKNDLQFIGRVRTGLLLLIPTLVWFLLVFIDSLMQGILLAEHLVYWINIAAIICSLVGLGFLAQAPVWHHVRSMLRMVCMLIGAGAAIFVIDRSSLLSLGEFQEYLPAVGGTCFVVAFLLSLTSLHELGAAISDKTTIVLSWPPLAILMLIFLISCLVYLPMSAVESLNQNSADPEAPTTAIGGLITIIQWLAVIMLAAFCLFLAKACRACKGVSVGQP